MHARRLKTGRVTRVSGASPGDAETSAEPGFGRRAPSSPPDHLRAYLAAQLAELLGNAGPVKASDDPGAVHDMRVAVRRLRSILRTGRPVLDPGWVDTLRAELDRYGQLLGAVRDLDVLIDRLGAEAEEIGAGDDEVLLAPLEGERDRARAKLRAALDSSSYQLMLERVDAATRFVPVLRDDLTVEQLARKELKKLRKFKRRAGLDDDRQLHKLRIRGKRARYAAELAESSRGKPATRFIKAAKKLQDTLGEHQDAVVALARLRELADTDPRTAFLAGRLSERERRRKRRARKAFPAAWKRVKKRGRAAW